MARNRRVCAFILCCSYSFIGIYSQTDASSACNVPFTSILRDDQFTASSHNDSQHNASAARFNSNVGWAGGSGAHDYLQVSLDGIWRITALDFAGSDLDWYLTVLRVSHSLDGYHWVPYNTRLSEEIFSQNFQRQGPVTKVVLGPPIEARYIAFYGTTGYGNPSLRLELYGCQISTTLLDSTLAEVTQDILVDTTWIPSQNPVVISSNVAVRPGVTLTVQAGVNVIFKSENAALDIYGTLVTLGFPGVRTLFSSNNPVTEKTSAWLGIRQGSGGNITLRHTTVRQAVACIQGNGSNIHISDSEIYSCVHGLRLSGGISETQRESGWGPILSKTKVMYNEQGAQVHGTLGQQIIFFDSARFDFNRRNGIEVVNWANIESKAVSTNLFCTNVTMHNNTKNGIYHEMGMQTYLEIHGSLFTGNGDGGVYWYQLKQGSSGQTLNIADSTFGNARYGINYTCSNCQTSNITIIGNTFNDVECAINITLASSNTEIAPQTISITGNYFGGLVQAIRIHGDSYTMLNTTAIIAENLFTKHLNSHNAVSIVYAKSNITRNTFDDCGSHNVISINGFNHTIMYNKFLNTTQSTCLIRIEETFTKLGTILAPYNYWDTNEISSVKWKVCDFFLNSSKAIIDVPSFFEDSSLTKYTSSKTIDNFESILHRLLNVTYIGGIVNNDLNISANDFSQVVLSRSLLIKEGVTVRMEGVILNITDNRGIVVLGTLMVGSSELGEKHRTVLQKHNGKWNSIALYNTGMAVLNTEISGAKAAIDIRKASYVLLQNCTVNDTSMQSLVIAYMPEQNISMSIFNCYVNVAQNAIDIVANDSDLIDIKIEQSIITSRYYIATILEGPTSSSPRQVRISVLRSILNNTESKEGILKIHGCSLHVGLTIRDSQLATSRSATQISIKVPLINTVINGNTFGNSGSDVSVDFCTALKTNNSKRGSLHVVNNVFKSTVWGFVFDIDDWTLGSMEHEFSFINNTVFPAIQTHRMFFKIKAWSGSEIHTLIVLSNNFGNSLWPLFDITHKFREVTFKQNAFINNSICLSYSAPRHSVEFLGLHLENNTFQGNTGGVIVVETKIFGNATVNLLNNTFVNNSGTSLTFQTRNVLIKHNFFENPDAMYNLKVNKIDSDSEVPINASLNYWGTVDTRQIEKTLFDRDLDTSLPDVLFRPYLGSKDINDVRSEDYHDFVIDRSIGGKVNGHVTLYTHMSPYTAIHNILVDEDDILTIQENVEIRIKAGIGFTVLGRLDIQGTPVFPVWMTSDDHKFPWRGIELNSKHGLSIKCLHVNNTKEGIVLKSTNATLFNVTSTYSVGAGLRVAGTGDRNVTSFISVSNLIASNNIDGVVIDTETERDKYISISHCVLKDNKVSGIVAHSSGNVTLYHCVIERNYRGVKLDMRNDGFLVLRKCLIRNNSIYAIEGKLSDGMLIDSSTISDHVCGNYAFSIWRSHSHTHIQQTISTSKAIQLIISNSIFTNNIGDGLLITFEYTNEGSVSLTVENNTFHAGNITFVVANDWSLVNTVRFANNTVSDHTGYSHDKALIEFRTRQCESMHFINNILNNNKGFSGIKIDAYVGKSYVNFSSNIFGANNFSDSTVIITRTINFEAHRNIFENTTDQSCTLQVPAFEITYTVNASHNYWGSRRLLDIVSTICGFEKDMSRSYVSYIPYFEDKQLTQLSSPGNFVKNIIDGAFGGEIKKDTILTKTDFHLPIQILRSIVIRPGVTLYIESGIELRFAANRGIYVYGSLMAIGDTSFVGFINKDIGQYWNGIIINGTSSAGDGTIFLMNAKVSNTLHGVIAYTRNIVLKGTHISNASNDCLTLYHPVQEHTFDSSELAHCQRSGLFIKASGSSIVSGLIIRNSGYGVNVVNYEGAVNIQAVHIANISTFAISVEFQKYYFNTSFSLLISNCVINHSSGGVTVNVDNPVRPFLISIKNNIFNNVSGRAINAHMNPYYLASANRTIEVAFNTFTTTCGVDIYASSKLNILFNNNDMKYSKCDKIDGCFLAITSDGTTTTKDKIIFEVSTNTLESIQSKCIVELFDSDVKSVNGTFIYNQLIDNKAIDGVVLINANYVDIFENILDNPFTTFDVYSFLKGDRTLNVTYNWWGSSNGTHVLNRIFDQRRDATLVRFNVTPTLQSRVMDCGDVNNCNMRGECVRKNTCRCATGWSGAQCSQYECGDVSNCYGNGICVGPNECKCNAGWSGKLCSDALCSNSNNCSGNGFCVRPDACTCRIGFTGSDCKSCMPLHWGPECRLCLACNHGYCDLTSGTCICDTNNWAGLLCDKCSEAFYGPECLPLTNVLGVLPRQGVDKGGNDVHIWGHNFPRNDTYSCKFDNVISNGTWKAWDHVVCVAPQHAEGAVYIEISPNGFEFTNNKVIYTYYASCLPGACGRNFDPPHGLCIFGGCSCIVPWYGENCTKELLRPSIKQPSIQTANEFDDYSVQLILTQGDPPIQWVLLDGSKGLAIDERTGFVYWKRIPANINPYRFRVRAFNAIGEDIVTWDISVPISYVPVVNASDPSGILPYPRPVQISGYINFTSTNMSMVPIVIIVTSTRVGKTTSINAWSNSANNYLFAATYYHAFNDLGIFIATARHPGSNLVSSDQISWSVLGMQCLPSTVNIDETILSPDGTVTLYNISALFNVGDNSITDIHILINGPLDIFLRHHTKNESVTKIAVLNPKESLSFDFIIPNAKPMSGSIYVVFANSHGTTTRLKINIRLQVLKAVLTLIPTSINANIVRGTQRLFDVRINNIGEVEATNVEISLPNDPRFALVSQSSVNSLTDYVIGDKLIIPPGAEAQMIFSVTIDATEALGELRGTIYVNTHLTSTPLHYAFIILSIQRLSLTVIVKDEYTYFADGSPLVAGTKVTLSNPQRQFSETLHTSNETGYVVFENIYEDRYTLKAEAEGHGNYSAVIIASASETKLDIFLQRIAVKYTWTVTPTTVQDKYVIQLQSTFETHVPMPVVTVEPSNIDTIPYELGEKEIINFNITNHGLIRANNVRFALPTGHPALHFESVIGDIGSIEANTSVFVPIKVTLKTRPKRSGSACFGIFLVYDFDCGSLQTRSIAITLTQDGSGWLCGFIKWGRIRFGGYGTMAISFSSNAIPVSCNCAKALLKSCLLENIPGFGCAMAVADPINQYMSYDKISPLVLLDFAFSCLPGGALLKDLAEAYGHISCIDAAYEHCWKNAERRRRDVSSDVVNNLFEASKPVHNFLQLIQDIFGDESMFDLETSWYWTFKLTVADETDMGSMISQTERISVEDNLQNETAKLVLRKFLVRWNNTAAAIVNGNKTELDDTGRTISMSRLKPRIEQYIEDIETASANRFSSIFDQFDYAYKSYQRAEKSESFKGSSSKQEGVCATVRVRILQDLVLTRNAFTARLEIENGENSDLQNIKVQIEIRQIYGSAESYLDNFSIGYPTLVGITAIDGTGSLQMDTSGSAEWLIIPYFEAAPLDDTLYEVGGILSYSVGGSEISVPLLPDIITVKPNPSLTVRYFHEKIVQGDDPFTPTVEAMVPFSLAVMVTNKGNGVIRSLKITSGQPEIVENKKGLLVTFKIISAQLGSKPIIPSMTVDFGDISSSQSKTARWLMTSSLMGTFFNYSATFENINPLGDPQLSLLDTLSYHDLIHLVRIEHPDKDDGQDDFLVNDFSDQENIPDTIYSSYNGLDTSTVFHANVTNIRAQAFARSNNKYYSNITLTVKVNGSSWIYSRFENTFASHTTLLYAEEVDEQRSLFVHKNVWQTKVSVNTTLIHLFDYIANSSDMPFNKEYKLICGEVNMYAPKFNLSSEFNVLMLGTPVGANVLEILVYDLDNDDVDILMITSNTVLALNRASPLRAFLTIDRPLRLGVISIELLVRDHGIPARHSKVNVTFVISEDNDADTNTNVTPLTSSLPKSDQTTKETTKDFVTGDGFNSTESTQSSQTYSITNSTTIETSSGPPTTTTFESKTSSATPTTTTTELKTSSATLTKTTTEIKISSATPTTTTTESKNSRATHKTTMTELKTSSAPESKTSSVTPTTRTTESSSTYHSSVSTRPTEITSVAPPQRSNIAFCILHVVFLKVIGNVFFWHWL